MNPGAECGDGELGGKQRSWKETSSILTFIHYLADNLQKIQTRSHWDITTEVYSDGNFLESEGADDRRGDAAEARTDRVLIRKITQNYGLLWAKQFSKVKITEYVLKYRLWSFCKSFLAFGYVSYLAWKKRGSGGWIGVGAIAQAQSQVIRNQVIQFVPTRLVFYMQLPSLNQAWTLLPLSLRWQSWSLGGSLDPLFLS